MSEPRRLRICEGCVEEVSLACGRYNRWTVKLIEESDGLLHFQMNAKTDWLCRRYGGSSCGNR
jgi:hypothetical protein